MQYQPERETFQSFKEQQNQTWGTIIAAGISAAGSLASASASKKASNVKAPQIDIAALNKLVTDQSGTNARNSLALEQELTPENAALRRTATNNLLASANRGTPEQDAALEAVLNELRSISSPQFADQLRSRLFEQSVAQAGGDLALGGQLSTDTRNEVTRRGISNAGRVGGGNLGASRAVVPRDLGLTSLGLRNQRLATASNLGTADANYNQNLVSGRIGARTGLAQLLASLSGNRLGQQLQLGQFAQSLQPPQVGLNPGNVADIYAGNQNSAYQDKLNKISLGNQANQQALQGLGSLFGAYVDYKTAPPRTPITTIY